LPVKRSLRKAHCPGSSRSARDVEQIAGPSVACCVVLIGSRWEGCHMAACNLVLSRCICSRASGVAISLLSFMTVAALAEVRATGVEDTRSERGAFRGPALAQIGRSGGGSSASVRPTTVRPSTAPPASPVTPSAPAPQSQLGSPAPQAPAIAPLSPQQQTQFNTGSGAPGANLALSPGSSQGSPSQQAASTPGGGGKTLEACMGFWEKATHMTKAEWRQACKRTIQEYPSLR
jgi:hypothetical protein